jgi:hypothetical protein
MIVRFREMANKAWKRTSSRTCEGKNLPEVAYAGQNHSLPGSLERNFYAGNLLCGHCECLLKIMRIRPVSASSICGIQG